KGVFLALIGCILFSRMMASPSPYVIDLATESHTFDQLAKMDAQVEALGEGGPINSSLLTQLTELQNEVKHMSVLSDPTVVTDTLNKVSNLIAQAKKGDKPSVNQFNTTGNFALNYQGYNKDDPLNGAESYKDFYENNANLTLKTLQNSTDVVEEDNNNIQNTPDNVQKAISDAQGHIVDAPGPTQAIGGLAEINTQILKQLQSMHTQLAAIAEAQSAADAKKIQEEATEEVEFNNIIKNSSDSAKEDLENIKSHPNNLGYVSFPGH
ncbi:MAG: hypothetical protein K2Q33_07600, partial [Gammaproteobacteria bacterium]|nr:hypothetical protein [Gammaproteobacteria bacterium]